MKIIFLVDFFCLQFSSNWWSNTYIHTIYNLYTCMLHLHSFTQKDLFSDIHLSCWRVYGDWLPPYKTGKLFIRQRYKIKFFTKKKWEWICIKKVENFKKKRKLGKRKLDFIFFIFMYNCLLQKDVERVKWR